METEVMLPNLDSEESKNRSQNRSQRKEVKSLSCLSHLSLSVKQCVKCVLANLSFSNFFF